MKVSGLTDVKAIAAGGQQNLALKNDRTVWGWGWNQNGELGDGTKTNRSIPVQASGLTEVKAIAAGAYHSLALKNDGTVWGWGWNQYGQLGNGTNTDSNTPVQVSSLTDVKAIDAGWYHSAAVKNDGTVWGWGWNQCGQLGNGANTDSNTPVQVSGLSGATDITVGNYHTAVIKSDGTAWAWGDNQFGQLGDGTNNNTTNTPVRVSGIIGVTKISAGDRHTMALAEKAPDDTAPTTTATLSPQPNEAGWNNSDVTVSLSAEDQSDSGVEKITYSASGAQTIEQKDAPGSSVDVRLDQEGTTTLTYYAIDKAGNVEDQKTLTVKIDKTPPEVSSTDPPNKATGVPATANISANFSEEGSGIDQSTLDTGFKVVQVKPTGNEQVQGTYSLDVDSQTATFNPTKDLAKGLYRAILTTGVKDIAGNDLAHDYTWTFATAGPPSRR